MNIITKSDVKKFISLLKSGLENGRQKELTCYTSASTFDGTNVAKEYYVSIEFRFRVDSEHLDDLLAQDAVDNDIKDMLKNI